MSTTTLAGWKNTVVLNVAQNLPLQTYEKALLLVEDYLSAIGGWTPDEEEDPTGFGQPKNGIAEDAAAQAIIMEQFKRIYACDVSATLNVRLNMDVNLPVGLDQNSVLAALEGVLNDWLTAQLEGAKVTVNAISSFTAEIVNDGIVSTSDMVKINAATAVEKVIDPRAIALKTARERYILDSTWNVSKFYTEAGSDLVFIIEKYRNTTYLERDTSATHYHVIKLNSVKYTLISGSKLRYE